MSFPLSLCLQGPKYKVELGQDLSPRVSSRVGFAFCQKAVTDVGSSSYIPEHFPLACLPSGEVHHFLPLGFLPKNQIFI